MSETPKSLTNHERTFSADEIIVSKTDLKGRITYVNDIFLEVSGYSEAEAMGQPHSLVRHPDTPRCLFKLLWDHLEADREIFVYLNNRAKTGDFYWVLAHITPTYNLRGEKIGYHSNRRVPRREAIAKLQPLYDKLLQEERRHSDRKVGQEASYAMLLDMLKQEGKPYGEFVLGL